MSLPVASVFLYLNSRGLKDRYPDAVQVRGLGDTQDLRAGKGRMVVATRGAGPGLMLEQAFDGVTITLRAVGRQGDRQAAYDDGEQFADYLDRLMLSPGNVQVGTRAALYVVRAGGPPTHMMTDKARRAHFSCSYVIPVASGL